MSLLKKAIKKLREHRNLVAVLSVCAALLSLYLFLQTMATQEVNVRKSPVVREFEQNADSWLAHQVSIADFRRALEAHAVNAVGQASAPPSLVFFTLKNGAHASVRIPNCSSFACVGTVLDKLESESAREGFPFVRIDVDTRTRSQVLLDVFGIFTAPLSMLITMVLAFYLIYRIQGGLGGSAKQLDERPDTRFTDVVGNIEAKAQLNRVTAFLKKPTAYLDMGARAPRGVLLVGPPGTGKTLLAKALAGESRAKFIAVDGSYFTSMFYGAGVNKVRDLFKMARDNAPCVLFIDEVDGIGKRSRSAEMRGGESEGNRIINRILVEMDGFEARENVVIVAATNHEDNIDEAMRRPGRFDVLVRLTLPTLPDRQALFDLYLNKVKRDPAIDCAMLARMTAGSSPADIANLVNKAASTAAEQQADTVTAEHLLGAIETQQMGGEVSPLKQLLSEGTRERLAYHEAAHALVAHWLKAGRVERLTIEPRGQALGVTYVTRESEDPLYKASELTARLAMILAGREAELLVYQDVSSGAADDLKRATELAINMVGSLGFSNKFGLLSVAGVPAALMGPELQGAVMTEARSLLEAAQAQCHALLTSRRAMLDKVAHVLLEQEYISGEPLTALLGPAD